MKILKNPDLCTIKDFLCPDIRDGFRCIGSLCRHHKNNERKIKKRLTRLKKIGIM